MASGKIYVIVHGHFYQPPRENPWTQKIPLQENARPHHDWNERITAECYRPNTRSRVIDPQGKILSVVNNFARMNFNIGPTLFSWLERHDPGTYRRIIEADRKSVEQHGGHGNAIAQVYNHVILPLANTRDKLTQIRWGVREFWHRYRRRPEAIWLAETAINQETVELLIDEGMRYVILSPTQAQRVRPFGEHRGWKDVGQNTIDTRQPYRLFSHRPLAEPTPARQPAWHKCYNLPEVRHPHISEKIRPSWKNPMFRRRLNPEILLKRRRFSPREFPPRRRYLDVFFYDGALAAEVSFRHLLLNAKTFAQRVRNAVGHVGGAPVLAHFATDGEVYGHHEPFADMCLAYAISHEFPSFGMELTNYGKFLAECPPTMEVELKKGGQTDEGTAWSCSHGVGRWYRNCGCQIGNMPGWNQQWRTALRNGLDRLRDTLAEMFEFYLGRLLRRPWDARDHYIECLLNRSSQTIDGFLARHQTHPLTEQEQSLTLRCMEAQKYMMYAYTSCAWFFDDVSGIEVRQNLRYAARAIQLADDLFPHFAAHHPDPARRTALNGQTLDSVMLAEFQHARSNVPGVGSAKDIYLNHVKPEIFTPEHAANHFLLEQLLERVYHSASAAPQAEPADAPQERQIYLYAVRCRKMILAEHGMRPTEGHGAPQGLRRELTHGANNRQQRTLCFGAVEVCDVTTRQQWSLLFTAFMRQSDQPVSYLKRAAAASDWDDFSAFLAPHFSLELDGSLEKFEQELRGKHFTQYGFRDLYSEDRERFFYRMTQRGVKRLEQHLQAIYEDSRYFLAGLSALNVGIPQELRTPIEFSLSYRLKQETRRLSDERDGSLSPTALSAELEELLQLSNTHHIYLDKTLLQERLSGTLNAYMRSLAPLLASADSPVIAQAMNFVNEASALLKKSRDLGIALNTTEAQNMAFENFQAHLLPFFARPAKQKRTEDHAQLFTAYLQLLEQLNFRVDAYKGLPR